MIGLIGPEDSVALGVEVADELGLADHVIGRAYRTVDEAPDVATELDRICQVLLFSGRFSYTLGARAPGLRAELRYVPHSGADLYGAIVRLLREHGCQLPRVSVDTIEPDVLAEAFGDLGLEAPVHVLPLEVDRSAPADGEGARTTADLVAFHRDRQAAGDVDLSLTCVGAVWKELRALGLPAMRIAHARSVVREALRGAHLAERLAITEATQPAAVLIRLPRDRGGGEDGGPYGSQRRRLRAREAVLDIAERLEGRLADIDEETSMVYTSRGTIERALARVSDGHDGPLSLEGLPADVSMGVGLGRTVAAAEQNARLAIAMGERDRALHVGFPDGEVLRVDPDRPATTYRLRETQPSALAIARELGIGPLALTRLTRALRQVDPSAVTATELARAYGIEARSARRLITSLQRAGIATQLGRQGGPRAGRPQTVYRIDLQRLLGTSGASET